MKFSGILLDEGIRLLERSYLPACQKTGKKLHILLTSHDIYLVQDEQDAHGMHVSVRIETGILFDEPFVCKSKMNDVICIRTSIDVLLKALRGASSHDANNVKLALRHRPLRTSFTGIAIPLLELSWKNDSITLSQEIPIEKPSPSVELLRVKSLCSMAATSRFYADVFPEAKTMIGILDQVKCFSDQVDILLTFDGDLHLVARANNSTMGVAFPSFEVFLKDGSAQKLHTEAIEGSIERRLEEAKRQEKVFEATVSVFQMHQVLRSALLTNPARILCGISEDETHLQVMLSYTDILDSTRLSTDRSLNYKLPTICVDQE